MLLNTCVHSESYFTATQQIKSNIKIKTIITVANNGNNNEFNDIKKTNHSHSWKLKTSLKTIYTRTNWQYWFCKRLAESSTMYENLKN